MRTLIATGSQYNAFTGEHRTLLHLRTAATGLLYRQRAGYVDRPTDETHVLIQWHKGAEGQGMDSVPVHARSYRPPSLPHVVEETLLELKAESGPYDVVWLVCHPHSRAELEANLQKPAFEEMRGKHLQLIVAEYTLMGHDSAKWRTWMQGF